MVTNRLNGTFTDVDIPCLPLCNCLEPPSCTLPCQVLECQQQQQQQQQQMQFPINNNPLGFDNTVGINPYDNSANNQQLQQQQQTQPGAEPQLNPAWTPQNNKAVAVEMTVLPLVYIAVMLLL